MKLRVSRNCHAQYNLEYHLILCTKYRKPCITEEMFLYLKKESERLFALNEIILEEIGYEADYVHFLISAPPQIRLSSIINNYKSTTSRLLRKKFEEHLSQFYWKSYFWSRSYLVLSSGGAPIETIRRYIQNQGDGLAANST